MEIESELNRLKSVMETAQTQVTRAELQREQALAGLKEVLGNLQLEFGVSSVEEAQAKRNEIEKELELKLKLIQQSLEEASA